MVYYADGLKKLLRTVPLTLEFFDGLSAFQLKHIEACFNENLEQQIGMMNEIEEHNLNLYSEFKLYKVESMFGIDEDFWKKTS